MVGFAGQLGLVGEVLELAATAGAEMWAGRLRGLGRGCGCGGELGRLRQDSFDSYSYQLVSCELSAAWWRVELPALLCVLVGHVEEA